MKSDIMVPKETSSPKAEFITKLIKEIREYDSDESLHIIFRISDMVDAALAKGHLTIRSTRLIDRSDQS